jgi:hypothetical protein
MHPSPANQQDIGSACGIHALDAAYMPRIDFLANPAEMTIARHMNSMIS